MNIFIKKHKFNYSSIIHNNYGFGFNNLKQLMFKKGVSITSKNNVVKTYLDNFFVKNFNNYNRILRMKHNKNMTLIKKQFSWRSLRLKQKLPVHGQRTHSNAKTVKK